MSEPMGIELELEQDLPAAIETVTAALKEEGFGVLTRIDVHTTLKEKIDADFRPYVILGACNPVLAHKALSARPDVGLLLPCNVTVEQGPSGGSLVRIINARQMMQFGDLAETPALSEVGMQADEHLRRVAANLRGS
ncbi:MAG: DUF302 domain-containing protein [Planctomycetota bacterium]|jgi:uncharacterized protein (DUF302 family)